MVDCLQLCILTFVCNFCSGGLPCLLGHGCHGWLPWLVAMVVLFLCVWLLAGGQWWPIFCSGGLETLAKVAMVGLVAMVVLIFFFLFWTGVATFVLYQVSLSPLTLSMVVVYMAVAQV